MSMNYLRKISDLYIKKISILSWYSDQELEISPKLGYFSEDIDNSLDLTFDQVYFTGSSAYLSQSGDETTSGYMYEKEFGMSIPLSEIATEIIEKFKHIKNIKLHYCNGSIVQFSRNDLLLNKPITGTTKIEGKFLQLAYKQKSIFPIAFQK